MANDEHIKLATTILGSLSESAFYGTVEVHLQCGKVTHVKVSQTFKADEPKKSFKEMTAEEYRAKRGYP